MNLTMTPEETKSAPTGTAEKPKTSASPRPEKKPAPAPADRLPGSSGFVG